MSIVGNGVSTGGSGGSPAGPVGPKVKGVIKSFVVSSTAAAGGVRVSVGVGGGSADIGVFILGGLILS